METRKVLLANENEVTFHNQVDYCVGTGRMGLALQKEYQDQLALVQQMIGFKHIRGHGLFCDDMAIYQDHERDGVRTIEYNFTYLDMVMDSYRKLGLKPFLELGFMPYKMASGTQTIFYWKGNTTPPKSYDSWRELIQTLLRHLMERYGKEEVLTWPIEVWNEPNLPGFWEHADMEEYFKLFENSFKAIKEVNKSFRVGGPAVCGGSDEKWIKAFMEFCHNKKIPVDFITRHHYTTEFPKPQGHYGYADLSKPEDGFDNLHTTREIIDSYPEYKGLQIHITEYNTSYIPNCPLHDTNQNAAYIAHELSRLGEDNESYSYWTFGDIFEEQGVPFTPFHGGFGMVANGCIPKPTFWSFVFFKWLKNAGGKCIYRDNNTVVIKTSNGSYKGIAWNHILERSGKDMEMEYTLKLEDKEYAVFMHRVDEDTCNPLKAWHDMGEPANPSDAQKQLLRDVARPFVTSEHIIGKSDSKIKISLPENAVVYFDVFPAKVKSDNGYDYNKVMQF